MISSGHRQRASKAMRSIALQSGSNTFEAILRSRLDPRSVQWRRLSACFPVPGGVGLPVLMHGLKTMRLKWNDAFDVIARVGEKFMKKLLENAGRGSQVRLGLTGSGQSPHYQVEVEGRSPALYNGLSHKEWTGDEEAFKPENLSDPFPFEDLYRAFAQQFRMAKGDRAPE
jgi:hypothetical protein